MEKEFSGYMVLFGPKPGQKLDPRFPVPVTICYPDGKEIHYVSEDENAEEVRSIRLALHQIAEGPEIPLTGMKIGDRVFVTDPENITLKYEGWSAAPGTIKRFKGEKIRVEIDNTGSQDTEGYNSYGDFLPEQVRPLQPGDKAIPAQPPKEPQPSTSELLKPTSVSSSQGAGAEELAAAYSDKSPPIECQRCGAVVCDAAKEEAAYIAGFSAAEELYRPLLEAVEYAESRAFLCALPCECCDNGCQAAPCTCMDYSISEELAEVGQRAREALSKLRKAGEECKYCNSNPCRCIPGN